MKGLIFDIQRFSIHDGPGIRTTVFLKGCPLRCMWCHNPESISPEPELYYIDLKCIGCKKCISVCKYDAIREDGQKVSLEKDKCTKCWKCVEVCPSLSVIKVGEELTVDQVFFQIRKDSIFYKNSEGGVTISGGEPMTQSDFVVELAQKLKQESISVALDTCGYAPFSEYEKALEYIDIILFDLKSVDENKHIEFTGQGNQLIMDNFKKVMHSGIRVFVRFPLIPGFNDDADSIKNLSDFIKLSGVPEEIDILPYNIFAKEKYSRFGIEYELKKLTQIPISKIEEVAKIFADDKLKVLVYS